MADMSLKMWVLVILLLLWVAIFLAYIVAIFGQKRWKIPQKNIERLADFVKLVLTAILGYIGGLASA